MSSNRRKQANKIYNKANDINRKLVESYMKGHEGPVRKSTLYGIRIMSRELAFKTEVK